MAPAIPDRQEPSCAEELGLQGAPEVPPRAPGSAGSVPPCRAWEVSSVSAQAAALRMVHQAHSDPAFGLASGLQRASVPSFAPQMECFADCWLNSARRKPPRWRLVLPRIPGCGLRRFCATKSLVQSSVYGMLGPVGLVHLTVEQ